MSWTSADFIHALCEVASENKFCFRWLLEMCYETNEYGASLKNVRPAPALLWHIKSVLEGADVDPMVIDTTNDCETYRKFFHELYSSLKSRMSCCSKSILRLIPQTNPWMIMQRSGALRWPTTLIQNLVASKKRLSFLVNKCEPVNRLSWLDDQRIHWITDWSSYWNCQFMNNDYYRDLEDKRCIVVLSMFTYVDIGV